MDKVSCWVQFELRLRAFRWTIWCCFAQMAIISGGIYYMEYHRIPSNGWWNSLWVVLWYFETTTRRKLEDQDIRLVVLNCWHSHPQACKHPKTDALRTQAFEEVSSAAADPSLSLQASYQHALGQMHREQLWPTVVVSVQTGSRIETVRSSVSESFLRTCLLHLLSDGGTVSECCFRCNCKRWRLVVVNTDVKESTDSQVPFLKYVCMWICFFPTMICWISGSTLSHAKFSNQPKKALNYNIHLARIFSSPEIHCQFPLFGSTVGSSHPFNL